MKPKTEQTPAELEAAARLDALQAITIGLGSLVEPDDEIEVHTHAGAHFRGVVEDTNAAALVMRVLDGERERVILVPLTSMDHAEIFEAAVGDEDEGDDAELPEAEEIAPDITPARSAPTAVA